jgi:hypothetical protein
MTKLKPFSHDEIKTIFLHITKTIFSLMMMKTVFLKPS